jgi:hypothetical protein
MGHTLNLRFDLGRNQIRSPILLNYICVILNLKLNLKQVLIFNLILYITYLLLIR